MSIQDEWIVLDTNIWIFGLRRVPDFPACAELLDCLNRLRVVLPRQILQELQANFSEDEISIPISESPSDDSQNRVAKGGTGNIARYQRLGCKLGDAVVSAHLEELGGDILVTENRDFLEELSGLPYRRLRAIEAIAELRASNPG